MRKLVFVLAGCAAMLLGSRLGTGPKPCEQEQLRPARNCLQRRPPPDLQLRRRSAHRVLRNRRHLCWRRRVRHQPALRLADISSASGRSATVRAAPSTSPSTTTGTPGVRFTGFTENGPMLMVKQGLRGMMAPWTRSAESMGKIRNSPTAPANPSPMSPTM